MKKILMLLSILLVCGLEMQAQKVGFDNKFVKVSVASSRGYLFSSDEHSRINFNVIEISELDQPGINVETDNKELANKLTQLGIGKLMLDKMLCRDANGLHFEKLNQMAEENITRDEIEIAGEDATADIKENLKSDVRRQLLKSCYIVIAGYNRWKVFYVEIDDDIINQAYEHSNDMEKYDLIKVPVSYVANGKLKGNSIFEISKKVPDFAVRGNVYSRSPFLAQLGPEEGVKNADRFFIYRSFERDSVFYSKKICTARATDVKSDSTRLYTISGRLASSKKGDVAVKMSPKKFSYSLMGSASFGDDARYGGRFMGEHLGSFKKSGIAHYFVWSLNYHQYKKEPMGLWWSENDFEYKQPSLMQADLSLGYGMGINLLGRIEIMPYAMVGPVYVTRTHELFNGSSHPLYTWDSENGSWVDMYDPDNPEELPGELGLIGYVGAKVNVNIWYPLQITAGVDYNYTYIPEDEDSHFDKAIDPHTLNRINAYVGFRIHF